MLPTLALMGLWVRADQKPGRLTLLYTTGAGGFLQSCGCDGTAAVGLAESVSLARKLRARYGPTSLLMDTGNLAEDEPRGRVVWRALALAGYDAVAPGPMEMAWAQAYARLTRETPLPLIPALGLPAPIAGLIPTRGSLTRQVGWATFGLVSSGPGDVLDAGTLLALRKVLGRLRREHQVTVLCTHLPLEETRRICLGELKGMADLVVGAKGSEALTAPEQAGSSWILPGAFQGRAIGVANITPKHTDRPSVTLQWSRVAVTADTIADAEVQEQIAAYYTSQWKGILSQESAAELQAKARHGYVSPTECEGCHAAAYDQWQRTPHARAVSTLMGKGGAPAECLPCHSQAYRLAKKVWRAEGPAGVECQTCHAGGILHTVAPAKGNIGRGSAGSCTNCHTAERSPHYDAAAYLARVRHW